MAQSGKKILGLCLIACMAATLASGNTIARPVPSLASGERGRTVEGPVLSTVEGAEGPQTTETLQPQ
ncbi:MAG: hypothetical protein MUP16_11785, partial [Sedimentisphaerales bacterium]|nr:hypothetical protein [Sedimentisphaerales bacterium]